MIAANTPTLTLAEFATLFDAYCDANPFNQKPDSLYAPVRHIMHIKGKRIRPLLALMACELFGGDPKKALPAAYAVEIFHNYTLVHDDIIDQAPLRRGIPAVHTQYGLNTGILAGDVMLSYAYRYLLHIEDAPFKPVLDTFTQVAIEVMEGQAYDIGFETAEQVTVDEYIHMIKFKTSVLLAAALKVGSVIAGATPQEQSLIYDFGLNLGLAFQIKDDYLDTFGDEKVGKRIGGDIIQNKKTYLYLTALQDANPAQKEALLALRHETDETKKVTEVLAIFEALNIQEKTEALMETYYQKAVADLAAIDAPAHRKAVLMDLAAQIHQRVH